MSKASLIALGVGAYLAITVTSFPASVAVKWFAPANVNLALVDGSIWRGTAEYGSVNGFAISDLRWRLRPLALLTGKLSASVETRFADGFANGQVSIAGSRLEFADLVASARLEPFREMIGFGAVAGGVSLELASLELVDGVPVTAAGTLRVSELGGPPPIPVAGVRFVPVGSFQARIAPDNGAGVVAQVTDEGGPLELDGTFRVTADRSWEYRARVKPRADASELLVNGLSFYPVDAGGYHELADRGTF